MREIKFRAWDNVAFQMYYLGEEEDVVFTFGSSGITATDITQEEEEFQTLHHLKYMQFTGLRDRNGEEIYEGDIVQIKDHPFIHINGKREVYLNEWVELSASGYLLNKVHKYAEVIGNIHETPVLLN